MHFEPAVCYTKRDERGRPAARSHCYRQSSSLSNRPWIAKPNTKSTGHNPNEKKSFATRGRELSLPVLLLPVRRGRRRAQSGTRASKKQHPPSHLNLIGEQLGSGAEIRAPRSSSTEGSIRNFLISGQRASQAARTKSHTKPRRRCTPRMAAGQSSSNPGPCRERGPPQPFPGHPRASCRHGAGQS